MRPSEAGASLAELGRSGEPPTGCVRAVSRRDPATITTRLSYSTRLAFWHLAQEALRLDRNNREAKKALRALD